MPESPKTLVISASQICKVFTVKSSKRCRLNCPVLPPRGASALIADCLREGLLNCQRNAEQKSYRHNGFNGDLRIRHSLISASKAVWNTSCSVIPRRTTANEQQSEREVAKQRQGKAEFRTQQLLTVYRTGASWPDSFEIRAVSRGVATDAYRQHPLNCFRDRCPNTRVTGSITRALFLRHTTVS